MWTKTDLLIVICSEPIEAQITANNDNPLWFVQWARCVFWSISYTSTLSFSLVYALSDISYAYFIILEDYIMALICTLRIKCKVCLIQMALLIKSENMTVDVSDRVRAMLFMFCVLSFHQPLTPLMYSLMQKKNLQLKQNIDGMVIDITI